MLNNQMVHSLRNLCMESGRNGEKLAPFECLQAMRKGHITTWPRTTQTWRERFVPSGGTSGNLMEFGKLKNLQQIFRTNALLYEFQCFHKHWVCLSPNKWVVWTHINHIPAVWRQKMYIDDLDAVLWSFIIFFTCMYYISKIFSPNGEPVQKCESTSSKSQDI